MAKRILLVLVMLGLFFSVSIAGEDESSSRPTLNGKHQAGIRLGTWINSGQTPPELAEDPVTGSLLETSIKDVSFFFEAYVAYNFLPQTFAVLSFGVVNRGGVNLYDGSTGTTDIGNLMVYPILLELKLYPLSHTALKFQPYLAAGGGLYYGRQAVQFTNNAFYTTGWSDDTETDFNYALGGGFDWLLNNFIAMDFNFKYMPIDFPQRLVTINKYDAVAVTVGIKYLFAGNK